MIFIYFIAKLRGYPAGQPFSRGELARATLHAIPPLGMPVIILGGIVGGVATPTEAAAVGAAYAFVLGFFVYHEIKPADLPRIIFDTSVVTASICIIISAAQPIGWVLTFERVAYILLDFIQRLNLSQWQILLLLNIVVLILGCFMEPIAIMVMTIPVILPLLAHAGIDPTHFGVAFTLNLMIGNITPPVGTIMYAVMALTNTRMMDFTREVWPFLIALVIALFLVTYIPTLAMWLPNILIPVK